MRQLGVDAAEHGYRIYGAKHRLLAFAGPVKRQRAGMAGRVEHAVTAAAVEVAGELAQHATLELQDGAMKSMEISSKPRCRRVVDPGLLHEPECVCVRGDRGSARCRLQAGRRPTIPGDRGTARPRRDGGVARRAAIELTSTLW